MGLLKLGRAAFQATGKGKKKLCQMGREGARSLYRSSHESLTEEDWDAYVWGTIT